MRSRAREVRLQRNSIGKVNVRKRPRVNGKDGSHGGSRASSADKYDDDLYDSEIEDGAWGPHPADEMTKSESNRDVLRGIRMGQLDVSTTELEKAIDLL